MSGLACRAQHEAASSAKGFQNKILSATTASHHARVSEGVNSLKSANIGALHV